MPVCVCEAVKERSRVDSCLADMTNDQPIGQVMVLVVIVVVLLLPQKRRAISKQNISHHGKQIER